MASDSYIALKELSRLDDPLVLKRCVKLKRTSPLQSVLLMLVAALGVAALILLQKGYLGVTTKSGRFHPPDPAFIPWGIAGLVLALAALVSYFCIRNYYLLDPTEHILYFCFSFLGLKRWRVAFRQAEILAITAEGKKYTSKYSSYWIYRVVALGKDGRREALSNWRREELRTCNSDAADIGRQMGCPSSAAPPESKPVIEPENGAPVLQFRDASSKASRQVGILILAAVVFYFIVMFMHRRH